MRMSDWKATKGVGYSCLSWLGVVFNKDIRIVNVPEQYRDIIT